MERIEPRSATAFLLRQGQKLDVVDPEGGQVCDLVCYSAQDVREVLSNGRTFDYEETISLGAGNCLWSNRSRPMLRIDEDTVGCHDFLLTPCSIDTFKHFYPDKPVHRGCFGNLAEVLEPYGVQEYMIPTAFNIFMNVEIDRADGRLAVKPPISKAGDHIRFSALMDMYIGLTACSAYASNGGSFKPINFQVDPI